MVNLHYIPTGEWESAEGLRERHKLQELWQYHPNVQICVDDILSRIDALLKKSGVVMNKNNR